MQLLFWRVLCQGKPDDCYYGVTPHQQQGLTSRYKRGEGGGQLRSTPWTHRKMGCIERLTPHGGQAHHTQCATVVPEPLQQIISICLNTGARVPLTSYNHIMARCAAAVAQLIHPKPRHDCIYHPLLSTDNPYIMLDQAHTHTHSCHSLSIQHALS